MMVDYFGKEVVVLGLAKSGTAIAKVLHLLGAHVIVNEAKPEDQCPEKAELEALGIQVICGGHPEDLINEKIELVVKNPGIPYTIKPLLQAQSLNIPIITEVEIAYQLTKAPIIAVTGSNGKTTTTTLIGEILEKAGKSPIVAGNIGTVLSVKALTAKEQEVLVVELSSFQLKGTIDFRPFIAILLNIYPAHLDYHQTLEDYIASKQKIYTNQAASDYAVINADSISEKIIKTIPSQVYLFSTKNKVAKGAYIENQVIYFCDKEVREEIVSLSEIFLKGAHLENVLAAVITAKLYGVEREVISEVLRSFKGVEHRLEHVLIAPNSITFYNDSKATNPTATITALQSFSKPVILIAGGLDRGIDFLELLDPLQKSVKGLITYGQTSEKLQKIGKLAGLQFVYPVDNIVEAVQLAYSQAEFGDTILLSPACASWDMFSSFEERGRIFKEAVHRLI